MLTPTKIIKQQRKIVEGDIFCTHQTINTYLSRFATRWTVQATQNWRKHQRAASVASFVKSCSSVYNNNDWISSCVWYISTRTVETVPRKLARETFLTRKWHFSMSTVHNHTDHVHLNVFMHFANHYKKIKWKQSRRLADLANSYRAVWSG